MKDRKKSEKYWGLRRNGWAGAVSGGQGQYRVGRGSIGCSTQVRFSTSQKISIRSLPFVFQSDTGNSSP